MGRARLHSLRNNSDQSRFWEGHEFTRAVKSLGNVSALQRPRCAFCGATSFSASCSALGKMEEINQVPEGRLKIARRFSAGPANGNRCEVPEGRPSSHAHSMLPETISLCLACYPRNLRAVRRFMKIKSSALVSALALAVLLALSAAAQPASHFDGQAWWNHVKVLADDKLEGRDTGSRGEREAQKYAVEQLQRAGAEPAGVNGFYQPVKFVSRQIVEKDCSRDERHRGGLRIAARSGTEPLLVD